MDYFQAKKVLSENATAAINQLRISKLKNALDYLIDFILLGGIYKSGPLSEHSYDFRIAWNRAHLPRLNIRL